MRKHIQQLYIGTYTKTLGSDIVSDSKGIYHCELNIEDGSLSICSTESCCESPTFLALHPTGQYLYAINDKPYSAHLSSYAIEADTGVLRYINQQYSNGAGMSHLSIDKCGRFAVTADYLSGNVNSWKLGVDGTIEKMVSYIRHSGCGPTKKQDAAHPHSADFTPDGNHVIVADLGNDRVYLYDYDSSTGILRPSLYQPYIDMYPGDGTRHCLFHPNGKWLYVINELSNTVSVLDYDIDTGGLSFKQRVNTLPDDFNQHSFTAELLIPTSGKFLLATNRGHDSIAVFDIEQDSGRLDYDSARHFSSGGREPRSICFSRDENLLIVANQEENAVTVFAFDTSKGIIGDSISSVYIPKPTCVVAAR